MRWGFLSSLHCYFRCTFFGQGSILISNKHNKKTFALFLTYFIFNSFIRTYATPCSLFFYIVPISGDGAFGVFGEGGAG